MPTKTPLATALDRPAWTTLAGLAVASVVAGIWSITGVATTWVPYLAIPPALGVPALIPPLRLTPLGETTWAYWGADTAGALVMLAVAFVWLRHAVGARPDAGVGRAFGRGLWATVVAVVAGNVVRSVFLSFATHATLGTYIGTLLGGMLVSALTGALVGVVVGAAAAAGTRTAEATRAVHP